MVPGRHGAYLGHVSVHCQHDGPAAQGLAVVIPRKPSTGQNPVHLESAT
jgi:hypothetical protein